MNVIGVLPCVCIKINILQLQWNTLSILFNISGFYIIITYLVFALDNGVVVMVILSFPSALIIILNTEVYVDKDVLILKSDHMPF